MAVSRSSTARFLPPGGRAQRPQSRRNVSVTQPIQDATGPIARDLDDPNLVANPGFEGGIDGWGTYNSTLARSTTFAREGVASLQFSNATNGLAGATVSFPTVVGKTYTAVGYIRGGVGDTTLGWWEAFSNTYGPGVVILSTTDWTAVRVTFTATSGTSVLYIADFGSALSTDVWYVDRVAVWENLTVGVTVGIDASGSVNRVGNATLATTAGITATGSREISASVTGTTVTASITSTGVVGRVGDATVGPAVSITSTGVASIGGSASTVGETVSITATGGAAASGSRSVSVGITATGNVATFGNADLAVGVAYGDTFATVPVTKDITSNVVSPLGPGSNPNKFDDAALSQTVTITASGNRTNVGSATVSNTVGIATTGSVQASGGAARAQTVSVAAGGSVAASGGATASQSVSITAAGIASAGNSAIVQQTVTITASGSAGLSRGSTVSPAVSITATGAAGRFGSVTQPLTVGLTAAAAVGKLSGSAVSGTVSLEASGTRGITSPGDIIQVGVYPRADGLVEVPPYARLLGLTTEQVYTENILYSRYGINTGLTVILKDGVVTVTDYPDTLTLNEADAYYLGGRDYLLTQSEAQALINAGRPDLVEIL